MCLSLKEAVGSMLQVEIDNGEAFGHLLEQREGAGRQHMNAAESELL